MTTRSMVLGSLALALAGCANESKVNTNIAASLNCTVQADCALVGGDCVGGECHATNECAADADCANGQTCVADAAFGGLCTASGQPATPLPVWTCSRGNDCPAGQGCASDGLCHVDGECHNTWQGEYLVGDCADATQICAASGDPYTGFCTDGRGGPDPYCRSTGTGACRLQCSTNDECGNGTCTDGFCRDDDECTSEADCSPSTNCEPYFDRGYNVCVIDDNPTCVPDGAGTCRLPCETDLDCVHGGGCAADHLCHASNECTSDADCDPGLLCFPVEEFGGLCGPSHE